MLKHLTLGDLRMGLDDLFEHRGEHLDRSRAGQLYRPQLETKRREINALPAAAGADLPLVAELDRTDAVHDGQGYGLWHYTEAVLRHPAATDEDRAAARRIREAFIPALAELNAAYAVEAEHARLRRARLAEREADLRRFPVSVGGQTLYDWAAAFLAAGETLDRLLSQRATAVAESAPGPDRTAGLVLRSGTIGLLGRFRTALDDEMDHDKDLPRNLDELVFGYLDQLGQSRQK
jgi:hypothetical protein